MLKRRFENIITYLRLRVTNAASELINAKIEWVKYTARGFRNKQNLANANRTFESWLERKRMPFAACK